MEGDGSKIRERIIMSDLNEKIYFPGLNGLRFLAALAVIITHIELLKNTLGYENVWKNNFIFYLGGLGVYFFFVLSGFLITYLLLSEKQKTGNIGIKNFYIRRILRIWPLYYLLAFLGFFVFPRVDFLHLPFFSDVLERGYFFKLISYIFILPNLALAVYHPVPHIGQLWSIGVEEQFYLLWPLVVRYTKNIPKTLIILMGGIVMIKILVLAYGFTYQATPAYLQLKKFVAMSKFECMALGAIGAYFLWASHHLMAWIYGKISQWLAIAAIPVLIYITPNNFIQDGFHLLYSLAFLVIILNVANNPDSIVKLENRFFHFLGKISYGIYMYHMFIVVFSIKLVAYIFVVSRSFSFIENFLIYFLSTMLTILVSYVSYNFFEKKFIRVKIKYSKIISGDLVKPS